MELQLRPAGARLIVEPRKVFATRTKSNIVIAQVEEERPQTGRVLAVGPDCTNFRAGDIVLYGKFSGTEVTPQPGTVVLILEEHDILSWITDELGLPVNLDAPGDKPDDVHNAE